MLSQSLIAYADNCTEIRSLYNVTEVAVDSTGLEEEYTEARTKYLDLRDDFEIVDAKRKHNALALARIADGYGDILSDISTQSTKLTSIYHELTKVVNNESGLEVIFKLEQQYIQTKQELTELLSLQTTMADLLLAVNERENKLPIIDDAEVVEEYRIAKQLKAEYDTAIGYEDIGDVKKVKVPTSRGEYVINSPFGIRPNPFGGGNYQGHGGLDIKAKLGDQNLALFDGVVVVNEYSSTYGNYIILDHGYGVRTLYGHATKNLVSVGETVKQYQPIQNTGSTGYSTGPHLHLALMIDGEYVDPSRLFRK